MSRALGSNGQGAAAPLALTGWHGPALLLAALLPLLSTPVLPLIDFYNHIARFVILKALPDDPSWAASYSERWTILPNIGLDAVGVGLLWLVPAGALPHVVAALVVLAMLGGLVALSRALAGRLWWPPAVLALPLLYSWIFNWGFAGFLLGLGLAMAGAAWWLQMRARPVLRLGVAIILALLIFFCHGLAFALYGLMIAGLELGQWWQQPARRLDDLASAWGLCLVQAVLPVLFFRASPTAAVAGGVTNADEALAALATRNALADRLLALAQSRLENIIRVAEGPGLWPDLAWFVAMLVIMVALWRRGVARLNPAMVPVLAIALPLMLLCPPTLFGSGFVGDRMPLFAALMLVAGLVPGPNAAAPAARPWLMALVGLVALRIASVAVLWHGTAADLADFDRVAARLPAGEITQGVGIGWRLHDEVANRCEMYSPLLALRHRHHVSLFAISSQQPLALNGALAAAHEYWLRHPPTRYQRSPAELDAVVEAAAQAGFAHVLQCHAQRDGPMPPTRWPVRAQAGRFRLLDTGRHP